jgi:regulator of RNase E activity RraA
MSGTEQDNDGDLIGRLRAISSTSLADASKGTAPLRMLPAGIVPVRPDLKLCGRALTVDASGGLMSMLAALKICEPGDVLVVRGSENGAVSGELFATEAHRRGAGGIVIDGYCRDRGILVTIDMPVYARGSVPNAPGVSELPVIQVPLDIDGVTVNPGDLLVGDADGIVVGTADEFLAIETRASEIEAYESALRRKIAGGSPLHDHVGYDEHLAALQAGRESKLSFA